MRALTTLRLLVSLALGWTVWALLFLWGRDRTTVQWWCDGEGCGSNDLASAAPLLAGLAGVLLLGFLVRFLGGATLGVVVAGGGLAAWSGLQQSVELGSTTSDEIATWSTVTLTVVAVGVVLAVLGGARTVRRTGLLLRLAGRASAPGRILVRTAGSQKVVSIVFRSADGRLHDVQLQKEPRVRDRRVVALYDPVQPDWPGRVRVGLLRPARGAARVAYQRALDELPRDGRVTGQTSPAAGGPTARTAGTSPASRGAASRSVARRPAAPALSRAEQIRHLDTLRSAGQITTAQADAAAAQVLADLFRATFPVTRR